MHSTMALTQSNFTSTKRCVLTLPDSIVNIDLYDHLRKNKNLHCGNEQAIPKYEENFIKFYKIHTKPQTTLI